MLLRLVIDDRSDDWAGRRREFVLHRDQKSEVLQGSLGLDLRLVALTRVDYLAQMMTFAKNIGAFIGLRCQSTQTYLR